MKVGWTERLPLAQLCFAKQPTAPKGRSGTGTQPAGGLMNLAPWDWVTPECAFPPTAYHEMFQTSGKVEGILQSTPNTWVPP